MEKDDIKKLIEKILNEKVQFLLDRIDLFQVQMLKQVDNLKQLDQLLKFNIPSDFKFPESRAGNQEVDILNEYVKRIAASANQLSLINNILDAINRFSGRSALFLLKDDRLVGWRGKGFSGEAGALEDEEIGKVFFSLSADTILKHVLENRQPYRGNPLSRSDDFLIYDRFGGSKPAHIVVLPFCVKGKPQAVIYADSARGKEVNQKCIEIIAAVGELSLDMLPLRQKILARVKTREFTETSEPASQEISAEHFDEMEKTSAPIRESDPERLARVIINDIILYNKKIIEDGIRNRNLYDLLKETLLQAKEMYLRKSNNLRYFEEQLITNLAQGDKKALKGYNFEAIK